MVFRWRRPLLLTYYDNYRYGTSLYSSTAEEIEKKYHESLSRTYMRSDRKDLGLSTFSGSQLQGGLPATQDDSAIGTKSGGSKKSYPDLYAPMSFGYGRSYYNHLRGSSEPRTISKKTESKKSSHYTATEESTKDIKSSSTTTLNKISKTSASSDYDTLNKTVTTTTTTERWVPLSHYLYPSTTSYYYYTEPEAQTTSGMYFGDDVKVKKTISSKIKRDLEALDLSTSSAYTSEKLASSKFDYSFWTEKCREIQSHLDHVNRWVGDAESKIKNDLVGARNKMFSELSEVSTLVEDTTKYNEELQRIIKRQAKQITDLHSQHDDINRHLAEVNENLEKSRARCQGLQSELANVQTGLEVMATKRRQ